MAEMTPDNPMGNCDECGSRAWHAFKTRTGVRRLCGRCCAFAGCKECADAVERRKKPCVNCGTMHDPEDMKALEVIIPMDDRRTLYLCEKCDIKMSSPVSGFSIGRRKE